MRTDDLADLRDRVGVAGGGLRVHQRHEVDLGVRGKGLGHLGGGDGRVERHREVDDLGTTVAQPVAERLPVRPRDDVQRRRTGPGAAPDAAFEGEECLALHDDDVLLGGEETGHPPLDRREVRGGERGQVEEGVRHGGALFGIGTVYGPACEQACPEGTEPAADGPDPSARSLLRCPPDRLGRARCVVRCLVQCCP